MPVPFRINNHEMRLDGSPSSCNPSDRFFKPAWCTAARRSYWSVAAHRMVDVWATAKARQGACRHPAGRNRLRPARETQPRYLLPIWARSSSHSPPQALTLAAYLPHKSTAPSFPLVLLGAVPLTPTMERLLLVRSTPSQAAGELPPTFLLIDFVF